ncbi:MAG: hypothetical protein EP338_05445 [Bacteroidetes bacterium]|nr:MAG: hypothetical protein EP338_05445 [Bacteroidota bacterium]
MKIKYYVLALQLAVGFFLFAQNTANTDRRHSKVLVQTLKEGEKLSQGEWKIHIKQSGLGYEFVTGDYVNGFNLYKDKQLIGRSTTPRFSDSDYWITESGDGDNKKSTLHLKNGKKYGPYDNVSPIFEYGHYTGPKIHGYRYSKDGQDYLHLFKDGKTTGPVKKLRIRKITDSEKLISYEMDEKHYVEYNGKKYGPYKGVRIPYGSKASYVPFHFSYQDESGAWKAHIENQRSKLSFTSSPTLNFFENGKHAITGTPYGSTDKKKYTFIDGNKYHNQYRKSALFFNAFGDVLQVKNDSVYYHGKFLGKYKTRGLYGKNSQGATAFSVLLSKNNASNQKEYYICDQGKMIFVALAQDMTSSSNCYLLGKDYLYIRKSDSMLMKNGKETGENRIIKLDVSNYPNEVIKYKKEGIYDVIYKNHKVMTLEDMKKEGINPLWYSLKENPYAFKKIDGSYYIIPKGGTSKPRPLQMRWNTFAFSKGNVNYAECNQRKMEIYINNELYSPGFGLTYNEKNNSFHWMSLDGQKVYLHTLKN